MYTTADLPALKAELQDYLLVYKELLSGTKKTKYVIRTGSSTREYSFQEINEKMLLAEIQRLRDLIDVLDPKQPVYRVAHHYIAWSKR